MQKQTLNGTLRERLGEEASRELAEHLERQRESWRADAVKTCSEAFDARFQERAMKNDVTEGFARVMDKLSETKLGLADAIGTVKLDLFQQLGETKVDLANRLSEMRVEQLRWSFAFWLGQVAVMLAAVALLYRLMNG